MRNFVNTLLYGLVVVAALALSAPARADVSGVWATEDGDAHVEIVPCGEQMCGKIVWLEEPNDEEGKPKLDKNNPDEALRGRPIVGMKLLNGFTRAGSGAWENGTIYSPRDGKTYKSNMVLDGPDTLKLRGYVGIPLLGKTEVWSRVK